MQDSLVDLVSLVYILIFAFYVYLFRLGKYGIAIENDLELLQPHRMHVGTMQW